MATVTQRIQEDHQIPSVIPTETIIQSRPGIRSENDDLDELEASIIRYGMLHPLVVRRTDESNYEVIAGNRRLGVARKLGLRSISAIIVRADDKKAYEMSLIENIQRKTLNPIEEAKAFLNYIRSREANGLGYGSVSELAASIGKSQEYVSNRLSLLRLPESTLQLLVKQKNFTVSHAEGLAAISENKLAVRILSELVATRRITVRELEGAIRLIRGGIETDRAIELARIEVTLNLGQTAADRTENGLLPLMEKSKVMLERVLRYVDNVAHELPESSAVLESWLSNVRRPIHDSIDGVIKSKKQVRKMGSSPGGHRCPEI